MVTPLTQMARCANGQSESPLGGSAGANGTRRPPQRRRAAETVNDVKLVLGCCGCQASVQCKKLVRGGHLLAIRAGVGSEGVGGHPKRGDFVEDGPRRGGDGDRDVLLQGAVAGRVIRGALLPALGETGFHGDWITWDLGSLGC